MKKDADYLGQLVSYIKNNSKKGYTRDSLKWALVNQGHSKIEVEKAFRRADAEMSQEAPILKTKPEIKREIVDVSDIKIEEKKPFWKKIFG